MNITSSISQPAARTGHRTRDGLAGRPILPSALLAAALWLPTASQALDLNWGPFSLTGFAKAEATRTSNVCKDCALFPNEAKDRYWADELVPGRPYGSDTSTVTLFQPYLGAKFDLGGGFRLYGLLSQRWRDGKVDIPGYFYEKNIAISHEEYGSLRIGSMTTRGWSLADYPYGTDVGLADPWGSSGAGYGLLKNAARYTSRTLDVGGGDLVLEGTYSQGDTGFTQNKPRFLEFWAQYRNGGFGADFVAQDTRNGQPVAWGHAPFSGLTPFSADDPKLGSSGQGMALLMARYEIDSRWEVLGGVRRNHWSGAYAVITVPGTSVSPAQWNNMFNVDWNGYRNGVPNPGYSASSVDFMAGLRLRAGKWVGSTGMAYLGKADTANPSERGQSNWATFNTLNLQYDFGRGLSFYGTAGWVHYGRLGLSPMSMPGNAAFTNVDSRVAQNGNWFTVGTVFVF